MRGEAYLGQAGGRSRERTWRVPEWAWRIVVLMGVVVGWEIVAEGGAVPVFWVSSPRRILSFLAGELAKGELVRHVGVTMLEAGTGYAAGGLAGVVLGLVFAEWAVLGRVMEPIVQALYAMPRIALAPLFILWFGIGALSKIVLVTIVVFFLVFMNVLAGARTIEPTLRKLVVLWGARNRRVVMRVLTLPAVGAWVASGLATSLPYAVVAAVTGEYIAASAGVGYLIALYSNRFNATGAMAYIVVLVVIVMFIQGSLRLVEERLLRWQRETGERAEVY